MALFGMALFGPRARFDLSPVTGAKRKAAFETLRSAFGPEADMLGFLKPWLLLILEFAKVKEKRFWFRVSAALNH